MRFASSLGGTPDSRFWSSMCRADFVEPGGLFLIFASKRDRLEGDGDAYENATEPYTTKGNSYFPFKIPWQK